MKNKPIVIAGNGSSLAQIDYRRLPADFDVFRCNQFYFENTYFLGRRVTGAFLNAQMVKEQYYTYRMLRERGEYEIENIYCVFNDGSNVYEEGRYIENDFPAVKNAWPYLEALPEFRECRCFWDVYYRQYFTAFICMLITALAQGYKEIYLVGLDFYHNGGLDYAFDVSKPNLIRIMPTFGSKNFRNVLHNKEMDVSALKIAIEMPGVTVYSVSEHSPVNEYVPLAPIVNQAPEQTEEKGPEATLDICILPERVFLGGGRGVNFFHRYGLLPEYQRIKKMPLVVFILDMIFIMRTSITLLGRILFRWRRKNHEK